MANKNIKLLVEMVKTLDEKLDAKSVVKTDDKNAEKERVEKYLRKRG